MKQLILFIALSLCLVSCKKEEPEGYYPKVGDSQITLIANWGKADDKNLFSKAFNDDGDYYYVKHKTTVRIISSRVDKVSRYNK